MAGLAAARLKPFRRVARTTLADLFTRGKLEDWSLGGRDIRSRHLQEKFLSQFKKTLLVETLDV